MRRRKRLSGKYLEEEEEEEEQEGVLCIVGDAELSRLLARCSNSAQSASEDTFADLPLAWSSMKCGTRSWLESAHLRSPRAYD